MPLPSPAFAAAAPLRSLPLHQAAPSGAPLRRPSVAVAQRPSARPSSRAAPRSAFGGGSKGARRGVHIERPAPNRRVVSAEALIHADLQTVWGVLSDYGRLAEYIPNLAMSEVRPRPGGGVRLEQCGVQKIFGFEFRAAVVMDMTEVGAKEKEARGIEFELVESRDFRVFQGVWGMERVDDGKTVLRYLVEIVPKGLVPVKAIEWRIGEDVPQNMEAVKRECEARTRSAKAAERRAALRASEQ